MKVNIDKDRNSLLNWFIICGVSTDKENFNHLIEAEDFNSEELDVKIVVNGFEFANIEDLFSRMQKHMDEQIEKRYQYDEKLADKLDKIQSILNGTYEED